MWATTIIALMLLSIFKPSIASGINRNVSTESARHNYPNKFYEDISPPKIASQQGYIFKGDCVGDFEGGNYNGWAVTAATNPTIGGLQEFYNKNIYWGAPPVNSTRVEIVNSTAGNDPRVPAISQVYQGGGNYGLRLGNHLTGAEADRITRTVTVTESCLSFWYAVVMQKPPGHTDDEMPFFMFRIYDDQGDVIDSLVVKSGDLTDYYTQAPETYYYKNWSFFEHNFGCDYYGREVTIEFITADCSKGDHFGYAYLDNICFKDCAKCCKTCDGLFKIDEIPGPNQDLISYGNSKEDSCCFNFYHIFDKDLLDCSIYSLKIIEKGGDSTVYHNLYDQIGAPIFDTNNLSNSVTWINGSLPNATAFQFCIHRNEIQQPKTIKVVFYDGNNEVICDDIEATLEPCLSSGECDCDNLFKSGFSMSGYQLLSPSTNPNDSGDCCFTITPPPYEDLNCDYYGIRVYREGWASLGGNTLTFTSPFPIGSSFPELGRLAQEKLCIPNVAFNQGALNYRIEFLDAYGKVICTKTELISCSEVCCENVEVSIIQTQSDFYNCCFTLDITIPNGCENYSVEYVKWDGLKWVTKKTAILSNGIHSFGEICKERRNDSVYMVQIKNANGIVQCNKFIDVDCDDCCEQLSVEAVFYSGGNPMVDVCCWDLSVLSLEAMQNCSIPYAVVYHDTATIPTNIDTNLYVKYNTILGRHCVYTPPVLPAPGQTATITYEMRKKIAFYDANGNLVCIKELSVTCEKTYYNPDPGGGGIGGKVKLDVSPNPFNNTITATLKLFEAMPVALTVVNGLGEPVYVNDMGMKEAGVYEVLINLESMPQGNYIISVNNGAASQQIIKQ